METQLFVKKLMRTIDEEINKYPIITWAFKQLRYMETQLFVKKLMRTIDEEINKYPNK